MLTSKSSSSGLFQLLPSLFRFPSQSPLLLHLYFFCQLLFDVYDDIIVPPMAPIPEAYFPSLDKCFSGDVQLVYVYHVLLKGK